MMVEISITKKIKNGYLHVIPKAYKYNITKYFSTYLILSFKYYSEIIILLLN